MASVRILFEDLFNLYKTTFKINYLFLH